MVKLIKFLICSSLICCAVADVRHLSKTAPVQSEAVLENIVDLRRTTADGDKSLLAKVSLTKEAAYDNIPFGYNGFPNGFPAGIPGFQPGFTPQQGFPAPGHAFPNNFVNPAFLQQNFPAPGFSNQLQPIQGFPGQGFPGQGFPGQGFPGQGFPVQGFPGQGFAGQGFPGQGFPGQGFPGQVSFNTGFAGHGYPNYPVYFATSEQLNTDAKENTEDNNSLRSRVLASDTHYDAKNGGYLYKTPNKKFK